MARRRVLLAVVVGLFAAACGGAGGEADLDVRPFSEVQATEFEFENDPTFPGRGIFRVTTTEPMICAIVWGATEDLGNFNNSLAMNGTGIVEHDVLLPGALAGETYYFRVQGSTADGTLYSSDLATFTLPADDAAVPSTVAALGPNLAEGASVVEVSSEFGAAWVGANAVDGDLGTEWSSRGDGDESYIVIDLGGVVTVSAVEFLTRTMADGSATTTTFTMTVDDGERFGPFSAGNPADPRTSEVSFTGRLVRFDVESSTGGNTGAIEIRVYGAS